MVRLLVSTIWLVGTIIVLLDYHLLLRSDAFVVTTIDPSRSAILLPITSTTRSNGRIVVVQKQNQQQQQYPSVKLESTKSTSNNDEIITRQNPPRGNKKSKNWSE